MDLYVHSRRGLEAAAPHEVPHIIISITSAPTDLAIVHANRHTLGLLRLAFPDYDTPSEAFPEPELFSREQARQIWALVWEHQAAAQRAVIHCEAGISRSAAVAAAIRTVLGGGAGDNEFFSGRYSPNARVYRLLLEEAPRHQGTASGSPTT